MGDVRGLVRKNWERKSCSEFKIPKGRGGSYRNLLKIVEDLMHNCTATYDERGTQENGVVLKHNQDLVRRHSNLETLWRNTLHEKKLNEEYILDVAYDRMGKENGHRVERITFSDRSDVNFDRERVQGKFKKPDLEKDDIPKPKKKKDLPTFKDILIDPFKLILKLKVAKAAEKQVKNILKGTINELANVDNQYIYEGKIHGMSYVFAKTAGDPRIRNKSRSVKGSSIVSRLPSDIERLNPKPLYDQRANRNWQVGFREGWKLGKKYLKTLDRIPPKQGLSQNSTRFLQILYFSNVSVGSSRNNKNISFSNRYNDAKSSLMSVSKTK